MNQGYFAKPLGRRQIDQAFPIIQVIAPDLDMARWREFAAAKLSQASAVAGAAGEADRVLPPAGIMTVQDGRGYIHGLFSYSAETHLRHGRVLEVENFIVVDLFDLSLAAAELLRAMDKVAWTLGCHAIHTSLPDIGSTASGYRGAVLDCFREAGHRVETLRLCKHRHPDRAGPRPANDAG